jgi:FlaG/FlaF family flagellin (archaellin)
MVGTRSTPPQASSPASPAARQQPTPQQSQESATVVPSAASAALDDNFSDEEGVAVAVLAGPSQQEDNDNNDNNNSNNNISSPTPTQQPQQKAPAALDVRIPKTVDVINQMEQSHAVKKRMESNVYITTDEEQEIFFQQHLLYGMNSPTSCTRQKKYVPKNPRYVVSEQKIRQCKR